MTGPLITVLAGRPDDAELAAVTAVLCAMASGRLPDAVVIDAPVWARGGRHVAPSAWTAAPGRHLGEVA